ncbi:MAG: hypothetical protein ABIJ18_02605 [archaeon]
MAKKNKHKKKKKKLTFKWAVIWILIHAIVLYILYYVLDLLKIQNELINLFILGLGVTLIASNIKNIYYKQEVKINKWFLFWIIVNTFPIWLLSLLLGIMGLENQYLHVLVVGAGLFFVSFILNKIRKTNAKMIIISIIILIILFLFNSSVSLGDGEGEVLSNTLGDISSSINEALSFSNSCPQLPFVLQESGVPYNSVLISGTEEVSTITECSNEFVKYGANYCAIYGPGEFTNSVDYLTDGEWTSATAELHCREAVYVGENTDYIYCDIGDETYNIFSIDSIPYIYKVKESSNIIQENNIERKSFTNIYDKSGMFIKTECGKDPLKIIEEREKRGEQEIKQLINEMDSFFS